MINRIKQISAYVLSRIAALSMIVAAFFMLAFKEERDKRRQLKQEKQRLEQETRDMERHAYETAKAVYRNRQRRARVEQAIQSSKRDYFEED